MINLSNKTTAWRQIAKGTDLFVCLKLNYRRFKPYFVRFGFQDFSFRKFQSRLDQRVWRKDKTHVIFVFRALTSIKLLRVQFYVMTCHGFLYKWEPRGWNMSYHVKKRINSDFDFRNIQFLKRQAVSNRRNLVYLFRVQQTSSHS